MKKMIFPKPEWIRYNVTYFVFEPEVTAEIYIYAHGEQKVRDILDDYIIIKIEREDKDD